MRREAPDTAVVRTSDPVRAVSLCDHLVRAGIPSWVRQSPVHVEVEFPFEVWVPRSQHDLARELVRRHDEDREAGLTLPFDRSRAEVDSYAADEDRLDR